MPTMNHNLKFYDHLLQFSLFQGLSRAELLQMAGNTKFGFLKLPSGKTVVREGDICSQLFFLISGKLTVTTQSDAHTYSVTESLSSPWLLQLEVLFGASTRFTCSASTATEVHFITLAKDEVMRLLDDFLIIRLNLLNILSTLAQRRSRQPWRRTPADVRQRITRFLIDHCVYPAGAKDVAILMRDLAFELNTSRLEVSNALNDMQREGLLHLHRGHIEIPSLERLLM